MARLTSILTILACSAALAGAGVPTGGSDFHARGDSLCAVGTEQALRQAIVEYTSATLEDPRDGRSVAARALVYADLGDYAPALRDADRAMIYGDEEVYYYVVGRSKPSVEYLKRAFGIACLRGDRALIPAIGKLLLLYETRYFYVTEEKMLP